MMMISMHTRYNTSISPLLHVVRLQLHPLDAIGSLAFIASYDYYIGMKLTVNGISCEMFFYDTHVNRQHRKHASYYISKKYIDFAEMLFQLLFSLFPLSLYLLSLPFSINENIEHEINYNIIQYLAYVSGSVSVLAGQRVCILFFFGTTFPPLFHRYDFHSSF